MPSWVKKDSEGEVGSPEQQVWALIRHCGSADGTGCGSPGFTKRQTSSVGGCLPKSYTVVI